MSKKRSWEEIDRLAQTWYDMPSEGNESAKKQIEEKIWIAVMNVLCNSPLQDAVSDFWEKNWPSFDPNKAPLSAYMKANLNYRLTDMERRESKMKIKASDGKIKWYKPDSLDAAIFDDEGSETSKIDLLEDSTSGDGSDNLLLDALAYKHLSLMLNLTSHLDGKSNNANRINYFRLFFTDDISKFLREDVTPQVYILRESELFQVMKSTFLDYFLEEQCRTVPALVRSTLKPYGVLVEGRPMESVKQPLPLDVFVAYLNRIEHSSVRRTSTISQQKGFYYAFLKEQLC